MLAWLALSISLSLPMQAFAATWVKPTCQSVVGDPQLSDREKILSYQNGFLADELELENSIRQFLREAPQEAMQAIGLSFLAETEVVFEDPNELSKVKTRYGSKWKDVLDRQLIIDISRLYVSPEVWEKVQPYFVELDTYEFISRALMRLRYEFIAGSNQLSKEGLERRIQLFLRAREKEVPSFEDLLSQSPMLREAFTSTVKVYVPSFDVDLSKPGNQKLVLTLLRAKRFGVAPSKFLVEWLHKGIFLYNQGIKGTILQGGAKNGLETLIYEAQKIWAEKDFFDSSLRPFFLGLYNSVRTRSTQYSGQEIRRAIEAALDEHHRLLLELAQHRDPVSPEVLYEKYIPYQRSALQAPQQDSRNLNDFLEDPTRINLESDIPYFVQFKRDWGHRQKIREIKFTKRGLQMLKAHEDNIAIREWLKALTLGFASARKQNGIKLLHLSPVPGMSHLRLEVKLLKTGFRMLGWVDTYGGYVFDYLTDEYHH